MAHPRVTLLDPASIDTLRSRALTYPEVGRTAGPLPAGYSSAARSRRLPAGADFDDAAAAVLRWQVQARSGLRVQASSLVVEPDAVVVMRFGIGRVALVAPCRVVRIVDEPDRRGFAYGTLPGHPESGEEAFVVERRDNAVTLSVTVFSRPAGLLPRLAGPVTIGVRNLILRRYLRALD